MRNELEDIKQQAVEQGKQQLKNMLKESVKKVGQQIMSAISPILPYIIIASVLFIIIVGCEDWDDVGTTASAEGMSNASQGMSNAAQGSSWEQFLKFVVTNEGGTKTDDGKYYIVEDDSAGNPTIGHGLCLKSQDGYLHVDEFSAYGIDSKKLADDWLEDGTQGKVEVDICDEIWANNLKAKYDSVVESYDSLGLKEYQYYALVDVRYRRGNTNGFTDAYNDKWSSSDDKYGEDTSSESFSTDSLYNFFLDGWTDTTSGVYTRKKNQWLLFKYGYYAPLNEYWEESSNTVTGTPGETGTTTIGGTKISTYTSSKNMTYIMYQQDVGSWASQIYYGSSTIAQSGCPTSASATALSGLGFTLTPDKFKAIYSSGIDSVIQSTGAKTDHIKIFGNCPYDTKNKPSQNDKNKIIGYLQEGYPVIFHVTGSGSRSGDSIFTTDQHWMALLDVNQEGTKVYVAVGNSGKSSQDGWYDIDTALTSLCCYIKVYK